jgi:protein-ribulosamine 3-kinase
MSMWNEIARQIEAATGEPFGPVEHTPVGGGCINTAYRIADGRRSFFVKLNSPDLADMFAAEAEGLQEISASHSVRVPEPVCWGVGDGSAFLVMENLPIGGRGDTAQFGRDLAQMHRRTRDRFGWHRDNTIGSTPQPNTPSPDWVEFWRKERLGFQLELVARQGHRGALQKKGDQLMAALPALFGDHRPEPSLLHGDLWSGNYAFTTDGEAVIFDPAVYFGDREADIAMTELFGGFGSQFYGAYNEAWPLAPGYETRKILYNLYHILNHLNLFGGGYGSQAESMMGRLLSELR